VKNTITKINKQVQLLQKTRLRSEFSLNEFFCKTNIFLSKKILNALKNKFEKRISDFSFVLIFLQNKINWLRFIYTHHSHLYSSPSFILTTVIANPALFAGCGNPSGAAKYKAMKKTKNGFAFSDYF
jgi:hypothetical protein